MNKKIITGTVGTLLFLLAGALFYGLYHEFIIIRNPWTPADHHNGLGGHKKTVQLLYWAHDKWQQEPVEIVEMNDKAESLKRLINAWLTLLDEEGITEHKISVQTALLSSHEDELFLSFDRNPFAKQSATWAKLAFIEGILKTIRENGSYPQKIRFLVHHQELADSHLDFSNSWPISGFLVG